MHGRWLVVFALGIAWEPALGSGQTAVLPTADREQSQAGEASSVEDVVVVTASRREERLASAPATMTVITEEAIANAPSQSVVDLMRVVPGVNIVQTSARDINITMRSATGTLEDSSLVLLDGRTIYQDFFGFVMWDFIPVDPGQIKQIEVIRGPASAVWGANALTGVVNVITRTPREMAGTSVSIQFGHFDRSRPDSDYDGGGLFAVNATHAEAPSDRFAYKLSAGFLAQESLLRPMGNVPGTQTPYPAFSNKGTTQPKLDARADFTRPDRRQSLILAGGIAGTEGIIHTGLGPISVGRGSTYKYGHVTYERDALKLRAFVNALDGEGVFLLQRGTDGRPIEPTFENQVYDVEFSNFNVLGRRHLLSYGGNFRHNRFDLSLTPLGEYRNEGGGYVQDEIFLSDRTRLMAGVRLDAFSIVNKTFVSPRTAFLFNPRPNQTVRLSFNRAFRAPSFFNSYMDMTFLSDINLGSAGTFSFPSVARGNLDLEGEALTAYEVAYSNTLGKMTVGAAAYVNHTDKMILFTQVGSYTSTNPPPGWPLPPSALDELVAAGRGLPSEFSYLNFNKVVDRGVELSLEARISPTVSTFGNYTWQDTPEPHGFSVEELNIPSRHRFNAGVSFNRQRYFGSVSASFQSHAFWQDVLDARYHGWTEPFTVVNASAGVRSNDGVMTVAVRAANLLNEMKQEHIFGDLIKRTLIGEVRFSF